MFWNKKKKEDSEEEQDLYDVCDDEESDDARDDTCEEDETLIEDIEDTDAEDNEEFDPEEYFKDEGGETEENKDGAETDGGAGITVTARVGSLNSLVEFISLRHPVNLQFMKKETNEVFELRESHFRLARAWGSVSMYRECSAEEYAKIALATELLENPESFYVLPDLTEGDIKTAMLDFCQEKYDQKSKKYAQSLKKFSRFIESNGDKEEWKLFLREVLYKKTEDYCIENEIVFDEEDGEEEDE